jgi:hypothetical protein
MEYVYLNIVAGTKHNIVYHIQPTVHSQRQAQLSEPSPCQITFRRQLDLPIPKSREIIHDRSHPVNIIRIFGIVSLIPLLHLDKKPSIHLIRILDQRLQTAEQECFPQPFRVKGEIADTAEATKGLAHDGPFLLLLRVVGCES